MNMKTSIFRLIPSTLTLICVLLVPLVSHAEASAEVIGKVIVTSGTFSAFGPDGKQRMLKRRSPIYSGDTLVTSEQGRAQIRLKDGAVIDIKSATELKLEEYSFNGKQDGTERSTMNLLKGGFRTITGAIGKKNKKNYKVTTRIATIGIRGTHYGIHDCSGNCFTQTASGREQIKDGLYGGVVDGKIVMQNDAGLNEFGNDQYFHLASAGVQPEYLMEPPAIVFEGSVQSDIDSQTPVATESSESSGTQTTEATAASDETFPDGYAPDTTVLSEEVTATTDPLAATDTTAQALSSTTTETGGQTILPAPRSNTTNVYIFATAGHGAGGSGGMPGIGPINEIVDPDREFITATNISGNDALTSIYADGTINQKCQPCAFNVTDASAGNLIESGNDAALNVSWGRWNNNFILSENGVAESTQQYFHYIYTDKSNITPPTAFQTLATQYASVSYNTMVGSTVPSYYNGTNTFTDNGAGMGTVDMTLDLTTQTVSSFSLAVIAYNGGTTESWSGALAGGPVPVSPVMDKIPLNVDAGGTNGFGEVKGVFVGSAAEGFAGSYGMNDDLHTKSVNGTFLIKR